MTTLLIVDDDDALREALAANFMQRGHEVRTARHVPEAVEVARVFNPEWALVDLKMPGQSGLALMPQLLEIDPETRIVVLTGYASIATAVEAIKLGAVHYLAKPVGIEEIAAAFDKQSGDPHMPIEESPTLNAAERELILTSFERHQRNISATARALGMHRRTLQRKLDKIK